MKIQLNKIYYCNWIAHFFAVWVDLRHSASVTCRFWVPTRALTYTAACFCRDINRNVYHVTKALLLLRCHWLILQGAALVKICRCSSPPSFLTSLQTDWVTTLHIFTDEWMSGRSVVKVPGPKSTNSLSLEDEGPCRHLLCEYDSERTLQRREK